MGHIETVLCPISWSSSSRGRGEGSAFIYEDAAINAVACTRSAYLRDRSLWTKLPNERQSKNRILNATGTGATSPGQRAKDDAAALSAKPTRNERCRFWQTCRICRSRRWEMQITL